MSLTRMTEQAQRYIAEVLRPGDVAIDGTVGNGHDTLFLAQRVGPAGRVVGFDVQAQALAAAWQRLYEAGVVARVTLIHAGHERLAERLQRAASASFRAAMFNLGFLPRGDKALTTRADTTLAALEQAWPLLEPGGRLTVLLYPGHLAGRAEADAVLAWAAALPPIEAATLHLAPHTAAHPPALLVVEKRAEQARAR